MRGRLRGLGLPSLEIICRRPGGWNGGVFKNVRETGFGEKRMHPLLFTNQWMNTLLMCIIIYLVESYQAYDF